MTNNEIEQIKQEKDGLEIFKDLKALSKKSWEKISSSDIERLKWLGIFFRKKTPGFFMLRIRNTGGRINSKQLFVISEISNNFGNGILDITTRQEIQLRGVKIESVPQIFKIFNENNLTTFQTGMDNIRNINTCPLSGLIEDEVFDAYPYIQEFTKIFLKNKKYSNLPRKFNVIFTGCTKNCTHTESQDLSFVPAIKEINGEHKKGFNVLAGGKMGSGGFSSAKDMNIFVLPDDAAPLANEMVSIFRDNGSRENRAKCRLSFLLDEWGIEKFKAKLEAIWHKKFNKKLETKGIDQHADEKTDHIGIIKQKQKNLFSVGLCVITGRITKEELFEIAKLSEVYGNGEFRLTQQQNIIIVNVAGEKLDGLLKEPILKKFSPNPSPFLRGLVACTGIDYCNLALIETKKIALKVAAELANNPEISPFNSIEMRWSGCPAGCGNHFTADIGFQGIKANIDGKIVDAVHVYIGGTKIMDLVPVDILPEMLSVVIRNMNLLRKIKRDRSAEKRVVMIPWR